MQCSSCGSDVPIGSRFCPHCGTQQSGRQEERRVVTVLFADIVGFTGLAEHLDPEDVKHLVDHCFDLLVRDIIDFGGVVDKILGDGIVALFGAPVAHEDDAERAVRAALRMQQTMVGLADEAETPLQLRIGVNTGEVLVGTSSAGGDYTAMGDVMNIAARLEGVAEPGRVVVGSTTHTATVDAISYRPLGRVDVRGREGGIDAWIALSALRPPGVRSRRSVPFSGRSRELALLEAQARLAVEGSRAHTALVVGEAGMGKTRLVEEAASAFGLRWSARVLEGRAVPYGEANVWWPIADVLRQAFDLDVDTPADRALAILRAGLDTHHNGLEPDVLRRHSTALMHAMGYPTSLRGGDRETNRAEVTLAFQSLLEAELDRRPVVFVMSDVHWAAEAVWILVEQLLRELARRPFVLLMTSKTAEVPLAADSRHGSLVLPLGPLDDKAARRMLADFDLDLDADQADRLVARSGGNPFFLEELATLVSEQLAASPTLSLDDVLSQGMTDLPDNLRGIIAARLDSLDPDLRAVLAAASVLGRNGPLSGLGRLAEAQLGISDLAPYVDRLVEQDFITLEGPRYEIRSELVREVAYGTLTKTSRVVSHHAIASYLEGLPDESQRFAILLAIARHYLAAAELLEELTGVPGVDRADTVERALHWIDLAGTRTLESGVPREAEHWFTEGIRLAGSDHPDATAGFLYGRARARSEVRDLDGVEADLDALTDAICDDALLEARVLLERGELARKRGDWSDARRLLADASGRLAEMDDPTTQAVALRLLGITNMSLGDREAAHSALVESRRVATAAGDDRTVAWAIQGLAWFAFQTGALGEAHDLANEAVTIFEQFDDRGGIAWALGIDAWVSFHSGDWSRARRLVDQVHAESKRRGDPWAEGVMLNLRASLDLWSGRARDALAVAAEARDAARRSDDLTLLVQARAINGRAAVALGRVEEGVQLLEESFAMADRAGHAEARRMAAVALGANAARLGDADEALRWAARFQGEEIDPDRLGETDLAASIGLALLQRGSVVEALAHVEGLIDLEGSRSAFPTSVASLVLVAAGDTHRAVALAEAVRNDAASTYVDRVRCCLALAGVAARRGHDTEAATSILDARTLLAGTDDRLSPLLFDLVDGLRGHGDLERARERLRSIGVEPSGWECVWQAMVHGAPLDPEVQTV